MKLIGRCLVGLAVVCFASAPVAEAAKRAKGSKASVKVVNKSDWEIHQLFVSSVDDEEWGPDQLRDNTIAPNGGEFTLKDIPCDTWDVKVVDEDGDECVVESVDMCREDLVWTISSKDLLSCQEDSN